MTGADDDPFARFSMQDRVVVVTGASSGLGEQFARVLHAAGATVVLVARRKERLEQLSAALPRSLVVAANVGVRTECEQVVDRAIAEFGRIDVLVNNAGTYATAPAELEAEEEWRRVMAVNVDGPFWLSQLAGRDMLTRGYGVVVNVASIMGLVGLGRPPQTSYRASKGALINLTRELAAQWARRGVRVNALCPGFFKTEMTNDLLFADPESVTWLEKRTPMQRGGEVDELNGAVLFLASEASSFMTGSVLVVDGGWTAI